jgi:hypothetical protein
VNSASVAKTPAARHPEGEPSPTRVRAERQDVGVITIGHDHVGRRDLFRSKSIDDGVEIRVISPRSNSMLLTSSVFAP